MENIFGPVQDTISHCLWTTEQSTDENTAVLSAEMLSVLLKSEKAKVFYCPYVVTLLATSQPLHSR